MTDKTTKSVKQPISIREKLLIGVLVIACIIGGYLMLRVKMQITQREVWQEQLTDSQDDRKSARPHRANNNDSDKLAEENKKIELLINKAKDNVTGIEGRFIDLNSKKAVADMRSRLTELLLNHSLQMAGVARSNQDLTKFTEANQQKLSDFLERPIFNVKLYGRYHNLLDFIQQLDSLPNRVVVTHFSLSSRSNTFQAVNGRKELLIQLTLSF
ncbi:MULTISPECIES: hypothetical protein [unclassified Moritella]|uniref:hypothetical protein n=1 Tax=unclassified Moritella TaxID=2637987 RepID=UPI001BA867C0|nr:MULTISPECIES: hypothetical protein [unclassified Moritella]QUM84945.1 hypothetical protein HWV02_10785 [Moritella sp. 28]QUM89177.1 hypothetical protein HWV03_10390 [Moritella sp. 36]